MVDVSEARWRSLKGSRTPRDRVILVTAASAALCAACGSQAGGTGPLTDAAPIDGNAGSSDSGAFDAVGTDSGITPTLSVIRLDNSLCDPVPLDESTDGKAMCRVLLAMSTCSAPGVSAADQATIDAVNAQLQSTGQSALSESLCELTQLAPAPTPAGACTDQSVAGWCYVHSACASGGGKSCKQALCTTPAFQTPFDGAWLACP